MQLDRHLTYSQNRVAILGDACHPTLPYQAQGAAMAVEDGAVLGQLLANLVHDKSVEFSHDEIPSILRLYESLRKPRTALNVKGAVANRELYHMRDGPLQQQRDLELKAVDWFQPCKWQWADPSYQKELLGFDVIADCQRGYQAWRHSKV